MRTAGHVSRGAGARRPYEASTPCVELRQLLREVLGTPPETSNLEVQADHFFHVEGTPLVPLVPLVPLLGPVLGLNEPDAAETASVQGRFRHDVRPLA